MTLPGTRKSQGKSCRGAGEKRPYVAVGEPTESEPVRTQRTIKPSAEKKTSRPVRSRVAGGTALRQQKEVQGMAGLVSGRDQVVACIADRSEPQSDHPTAFWSGSIRTISTADADDEGELKLGAHRSARRVARSLVPNALSHRAVPTLRCRRRMLLATAAQYCEREPSRAPCVERGLTPEPGKS